MTEKITLIYYGIINKKGFVPFVNKSGLRKIF
jgi:hypothetical protein